MAYNNRRLATSPVEAPKVRFLAWGRLFTRFTTFTCSTVFTHVLLFIVILLRPSYKDYNKTCVKTVELVNVVNLVKPSKGGKCAEVKDQSGFCFILLQPGSKASGWKSSGNLISTQDPYFDR